MFFLTLVACNGSKMQYRPTPQRSTDAHVTPPVDEICGLLCGNNVICGHFARCIPGSDTLLCGGKQAYELLAFRYFDDMFCCFLTRPALV